MFGYNISYFFYSYTVNAVKKYSVMKVKPFTVTPLSLLSSGAFSRETQLTLTSFNPILSFCLLLNIDIAARVFINR